MVIHDKRFMMKVAVPETFNLLVFKISDITLILLIGFQLFRFYRNFWLQSYCCALRSYVSKN